MTLHVRALHLCLGVLLMAPAPLQAAAADPAPEVKPPIVIGHRGASGYRPEHTLAAYTLAIEQGADFIEPDLVISRDGHLLACHENELSDTTDVAQRPEFADRRRTQTIDGHAVRGWFAEDFSLAELKTLQARERIPELRPDNRAHENGARIPTLAEVIELAQRKSRELGRVIGIYPETKHPSHFRGIGLPLEPPLLELLREYGLDRADAPVLIQSFETTNLRALKAQTPVRLVQLFGAPQQRPPDLVLADDPRTYADLATPKGLAQIARYAYGIGPPKTSIIPRDAVGRSLPPTRLLADAHAAGLAVHPYTFRNENLFLPRELRLGNVGLAPQQHGDAIAEYLQFFALGVDGVFSDHPDTAIKAREQFLRGR